MCCNNEKHNPKTIGKNAKRPAAGDGIPIKNLS